MVAHARFNTRLHTVVLEDRCVPDATVSVIDDTTMKPDLPVADPIVYMTATPTATTPTVPPVETAKRFAVGSGGGATAIINVYSTRTNALLTTLTPFGTNYTGGVRVATADYNGDGIDDVAAVTTNGTPRVAVFDGKTGNAIASFTPWGTATGGAFVASGDVTGDGRADLVIGSGIGQAPEIVVYSGTDLSGNNPNAYRRFTPANGDAAYGVRVAAGDLNGDGLAEIVSASKNSVTINTLSIETIQTSANRRGSVLKASSASTLVKGLGTAADTKGIYVAIGDFTGTGQQDIAAGFVANGVARIRVVSGTNSGKMLMTSFGFTEVPSGGVPVTFRDINGSGKSAVIAAGGNGTSQVRVLNAQVGGLARSFMSMTPYYNTGVFVG